MAADETGWLIEFTSTSGRGPSWWAASPDPSCIGGFETDSLKATRFARKKDAQDMAAFLHAHRAMAFEMDMRKISITEHMWTNPTPPSGGDGNGNG